MNTLNEMLFRLTKNRLKSMMRWFPDAAHTGTKEQLVGKIMQSLMGNGLRALWDRLDETQRTAVAETAYAPDGLFDENRFHAKHGCLPEFTVKENGRYSYYGPPTALGLFLYDQDGYYSLPVDMRERLKAFVPEPESVQLSTSETLPESIDENRLTVRHTERDAMVDLSVLLRLMDQGKIQVSEKTSLPGAATLRLLTESLAGGDFYAHKPPQDQWDQESGPIKAFSWPLLLQAAGLVQRNGSKLALSAAGRKALASSPASVLSAIWNKWLKSSLFDEFSRVDVIKGQKSKGRVMTPLAPRRTAITEMLRLCPIGAWINVDDISRFMQATGRTFDVTHDPWKLYVIDPQYGALGHNGYHGWNILQLRYLLCFLFEYAAALGIVDVAYIEATGARADFCRIWGTDDLAFLSRYDGLIYFRVTPLGAYCLGLNDDYTAAPIQPNAKLSVLPSLQINVVGGNLSAEELLTLGTWAVEATDKSWRLDRQKAVEAVERGHDIDDLRVFLKSREDQPLPETVESFMKIIQQQGKALKISGTRLLIDCQNAEIATLIARHKELAGLCQLVGNRQLIVRLENEGKFRALIHTLGFGMPA